MGIWEILGIAKTKDRDVITHGYRTKLEKTHPEDDPEGFKVLRKAYEEALQYCEEDYEELSAVDVWIEKVEELYSRFYSRIDVNNWKRLLEDNICMALETHNQVSEALLVFIMSHYRMPEGVFKLLNQYFNWEEQDEELRKTFPPEFINFIMNAIKNGDYINYAYFDGDEYENFDEYINALYDLRGAIFGKNYDEAGKFLQRLNEMDIYHPYKDVEQIYYWTNTGFVDQANEKALELYNDFPEDPQILIAYAETLWSKEEYENAKEVFSKADQLLPGHVLWRRREMEYLKIHGDYEEAKEKYYALLRDHIYDHSFEEFLLELNEKLIPYYEKKLKTEDKTITKVDLAWCYYEKKELDKAIDLLNGFEPKEDKDKYYKIKGYVYYSLLDYENTIQCLEYWLEEIKEETDEERKKKNKDDTVNTVAPICAYCYMKLGNIEKGKEIMEKTIKIAEDKLGLYLSLNSMLNNNYEYEEIIQICTEAMLEEGDNEHLLLQRGIAYYHLGEFTEASQDIRRILEISPNNHIANIYKMKICLNWKDKKGFLDTLEELENIGDENLDKEVLPLYRIKELRVKGQIREALTKALEMVDEIQENDLSDETICEIYHEIGLCYWEEEELLEAEKYIDKALAIAPWYGEYILDKGSLLLQLDENHKAEELYLSVIKKYPKQAIYYVRLGGLKSKEEDYEESKSYYERALELDPTWTNIYYYLAELMENQGKYKESLPYLDKLVELSYSPRSLLDRGTAYMENLHVEKAIEDLLESLSLDPDSRSANCNLGMAYLMKNEYNEAEKYLLKSMEDIESIEGYNPYYYLMLCYARMRRYEDGIRILDIGYEKFSDFSWIVDKKLQLYMISKDYNAAIKLGKGITYHNKNNVAAYKALVTAYLALGKKLSYKMTLNKAIKNNPNNAYFYEILGNFYYQNIGDYEEAIKHYKMSISIDSEANCEGNMGGCLWHLNRMKKDGTIENVKEIVNPTPKQQKIEVEKEIELKRSIEKNEGYLINDPPVNSLLTINTLAEVNFFLGNYEESKRYCEMARTKPMCNHCLYSSCHELSYNLGMLAEAEKDYEKAADYFEDASKTHELNVLYSAALKRVLDKIL